MSEPRLLRFSPVERAFHLLYLVAFLTLALTGAVLYLAPLAPWAAGEAGAMTRIVHRVSAVVLVIGPLVYLLFDFRNCVRSIARMFSWTPDDFVWLLASPRYYWLGQRRGIPPAGKYDTGQKLNGVIQIECFAVFVVTGSLMWFWGPALSPTAFRVSVILHDAAFVFAFGFFVLHVYMALLHPLTRRHVTAMVDGTIEESAAREHYPRWYAEVRGDASRTR